jgi:glycosyltransferase involved in cell wall biosynthesis
MHRVSVIVPTYNRAGLIGETLTSVKNQSFRDYEIIVVDDGSTDQTVEMLASFKEQISYRSIRHAGQGVARNAGFEIARGELVAFLDSDDLWNPLFLEKMTGALDRDPRAGFVYCDYDTFDELGVVREANVQRCEKLRGSLFTALLRSDFLCMGAVLIRSECIEDVGGFDIRLPPVEDWDMWLRLARKYDADYVDESLVRIRLNKSNPSRNPGIVYPLNLRVLAKLQREFPEEARRHRPLIRQQISRYHLALAKYLYANRQLSPALKHLGWMVASRYV